MNKKELNILSKKKIDRVLRFMRQLKHTKGIFHGMDFEPLAWQEKIIRDIYGTLKPNGYRQYKSAYIEMPKKNGKSEKLAALALYHLCADGEWNAEVYGCAADKAQASIIFDVAVDMVDQNETLKKVIKPIISVKRLVYLPTKSFYQVVSAEAYSKHGLNISCCLFDEIHAQPSRDLYDVMTFGSGDARAQPLFFFITTAGNDPDKMSIGWEVHKNAEDILLGNSNDKTTYAAIWGLDLENNRIWKGKEFEQRNENNKINWKDKEIWKQINPSMGETIQEETIVEAFDKINGKPYEEKLFKQLRCNIWISDKYTNWVSIDKWMSNSGIIDLDKLKGKLCYGGLDLSSKLDTTAFVLVFPPYEEIKKYTILPTFFLPEGNLQEIIQKDKVKYDEWVEMGLIKLTPENKIDNKSITNEILRLSDKYNIDEIGYDQWHADAVAENLSDEGHIMVEIRQNYQNFSPSMKEIEALLHNNQINHGNNQVLNWMFSNLQVKSNDNGDIRPIKPINVGSMNKKGRKQSKIDGIVAMIIAFCRVFANEQGSVYDSRKDGEKLFMI